jgi:DNA invertase Pin-like site-specific DNA recombinase
MKMTIFGYARVSTDGQLLDGQMAALKNAGCTAKTIFEEKQSGARRKDRKQLTKAIAKLAAGDVLIVTRLDRLARSTRDLLNILHDISERKAGFKSLAEPMIDTTSPHGKLVTGILGCLAEFERELIIARTTEGRQRARANSVPFGRPPKLTPYQWKEARKRAEAGETEASIARVFNVHQSTIHRLLVGETIAAGKTP